MEFMNNLVNVYGVLEPLSMILLIMDVRIYQRTLTSARAVLRN